MVKQIHKNNFTNKTIPFGNDEEYTLRKLRKKLRQIENLQRINRVLSEEERIKIASQDEIRKQIQELISKLNEENAADETTVFSQDQLLIDFADNNEDLTLPQLKEDCLLHESLDPVTKLQSENELNSFSKEASAILDSKQDEAEKNKLFYGSSGIDWHNETFCISNLIGHNDIIYCVDADESYIITCSRDTTVKVWDARSGEEINSLRGHKAAVTSVILVPEEIENIIISKWQIVKNIRLAISGGHDCMIFIWSILEGHAKHSVYTYNAITCLGIFETENLLITGTDGGKIELWKLPSLEDVNSLLTYEDSISKIKIENNLAFISSSEGIISVIEVRDKEMHCLFSSESVLSKYKNVLTTRNIRSLDIYENNIYYGDDGVNVKVIDWKSGIVSKLINHLNQNGMTDAIGRTNHEIIFSSYNIETGESILNIYTLPENQYVATVKHNDKDRIMSIVCTRTTSGKLRIVTAGKKLKIWEAIENIPSNLEMTGKTLVKPVYISQFVTTTLSSEIESTDESDDSDSENVEKGRFEKVYYFNNDANNGTLSFCKSCNIL